MENKNEIRDELKKLSPFLSKIKKEEVFKVPANYFNSLPDKVMKQVRVTSKDSEQTVTPTGWIDRLIENFTFLLRPKYAVGFTIAATVIVVTVYFLKNPNIQLDGSYPSVADYVSDNIDEFDAEMLWEAGAFESEENNEKTRENDFDDFYEEIIDELDDDELEKLL